MNADPKPAKAIFLEAVERHTPDHWPAFLDSACKGHPELRGEVQALLLAHQEVGTAQHREFAEGADPDPVATGDLPPTTEAAGTVIGPYKLVEQIGEGGMGTVWMAQQIEPVKRQVAVKLIRAGMVSNQVIARFEAERQALALMDHPNIARVLDAGTTAAGRPYFVMDLVKGEPITKYCDEHHLTPRQRLELFLPVCQAVQHAHQKGIIHRDLKPSNVMVALYDGKPVPKVIDFGVAKAAGQSLTDKTLVTGFGAIVGTLEYMSPEQAEVNQLDIDTRSDIYSLGVMLYELLAGSTPFSKKDLEKAGMLEMLRVIREDEPSKPSTKLSSSDALPTLSANRGTEPAKLTRLVRGELDWIVMKALEKDRNRRYETANGFAMDVQRYLADEAVQACPPSAGYRLRKFARRNKTGLAISSVIGLALLLAVGSLGWAVRDRGAREEQAARERQSRQAKLTGQVDLILSDVDRLEREQMWPEALAAARRAEAVLAGGEADAATEQRVRERLKDLEFVDRLEQIRMQQATWIEGKFDHAGADREYARAFREYGVDVKALAVETSIDRLKARPALAIPLAAALDGWVGARRWVSEVDSVGWKRLVAIARGIDPEPLRDRLRSTWGLPVPEVQDELRRLAESIDTRAQHPATLVRLADTLLRANQLDSTLRLLRGAQSVYPGDFWLNFNLGRALAMKKDHEGAVRFYTAAVAIRPRSAVTLSNLGVALTGQTMLDEAIASCQKAIEIDPKFAGAYTNLGLALAEQKKLDEAIVCHQKAIEIDPKYAGAYSNLGNVLKAQGKLDEAIACYQKAIEIDPKFASAYTNLGIALAEQKKLGEAIAASRKAIEIDPKFAGAYTTLGVVLRDQGKLDEAIACCQKAIELDPKFAHGYTSLGNVLKAQGKLDEAIACYQKAIELDPKLALAHYSHGALLCDNLREYEKAIECFHKAIELDPKYAHAHAGLGNALSKLNKVDEAIAAYNKAIELDPKNIAAYINLGFALSKLNKVDEAIAAYHKAIELDPKHANAHYNLGIALFRQKKWDEAIAAYNKAIELDPKKADAHAGLGSALANQMKWDEAIAAFNKALELDPKNAAGHSNLSFARGMKCFSLVTSPDPKLRDPKRAIEAVNELVKLTPESAVAWQFRGWVEYRIGNYRASIDSLEKSCKLEDGGDYGQWFVLALAHARLAAQDGLPEEQRGRHHAEARRRYEQADKQFGNPPHGDRPRGGMHQAIWDFRAEARELIGPRDGKK